MEGGTRVRRTVIWGAVVAVLAALLFSTTALAGVGQGAGGSDVAAQQTSPTAVVTQVATVVITQTPVPAATNEGGFLVGLPAAAAAADPADLLAAEPAVEGQLRRRAHHRHDDDATHDHDDDAADHHGDDPSYRYDDADDGDLRQHVRSG